MEKKNKPEPDNLLDVIRAKEEAIARSETNADSEWKEEASRCLYKIARTQATLTADDLREYMEALARTDDNYPQTRDKRATGPVMMRAAKDGYIEGTDRQRKGRFVSSHGRPQQVWRSLIYNGNGSGGDND